MMEILLHFSFGFLWTMLAIWVGVFFGAKIAREQESHRLQ